MRKISEFDQFPYNCCGLLLSEYASQDGPFVGAGFLIGPRLLIASTLNVYNEELK